MTKKGKILGKENEFMETKVNNSRKKKKKRKTKHRLIISIM